MAVQTERGIPLSALSSNFLHTNSTSHTWPFGAIAELIDNAYDPDVDAKQLWIDKMEIGNQDCLVFMDNGKGMDYDKMHKMLSFGFSDKPVIDGHVPVGIYGNGFKSGSMRLGDDAIVFSKKSSNMCVGLLSQTYLKKTKAEHIVVPIVEFTYDGTNISPVAEHSASLEDILRYSLFQTEAELHSELMAINGPYSTDSAGTRIIIWNLRKTSLGKSEFDFSKDRYDIIIPDDVFENSKEQYQRMECITQSVPESNCSLRAYCSILYLKPRMQIIIRGQKVRTQLISKSLAIIQKDRYKPQFLQEALTITFGYNTKSKEQYGIMMYHKNRLIKAYERVGCQLKANKTGVGIIGVIECNYLKPTHNKQDFNFTEEYRKTIYNVAIKLEEYWKEIKHRWERPNCPVPVEDIVKQQDQNWVQCDSCLKWRKLPDGIDIDQLPEKWYCHKNPYHQFRSCDVPEESEDSDDEQPTYQKTYKKHEKNKMKQQEMTKKKSSARSPSQATAVLSSNSSLLTSSASDNLLVIPNISDRSTTPTRNKRTMFLTRENLAAKRFRMKCLDSNMPSSPSASTASPKMQSVVRGQPLNNETQPGDSNDDDDITIVENKSSPRPKPLAFDLSKVKSEQQAVGNDDATLETSMAKENSTDDLDLSFCPSTEQVSATTQTSSTPHLKLEEDSQECRDRTNKQEDRDSLQSESDQCLPQVENRPNQELQAMDQGSSSYKSNYDAANQMENMKSGLQESETQKEMETEKIPVKLPDSSLDLPNKEHWSMLDAQQQQDSLLELLEATSQERDSNWSQVQVLTSRMEDLSGKLLQLSQSKVKKEMCEQSTQTSSTEEGDYRELYLQASKELEDLRNKLERERAEWTELVERERNGPLSKRGQAGLKEAEVDDEVACQIDLLLRELDKRNEEQEELKHKLDSLEGERQTLLTCCESMQKDLEEIKKENKEVKTNLEHCEARIKVPNVYQEEREVAPAETRNSWAISQLKANQGGTLGGAESEMNQGNESTETLRLRELRQKVARLLVTFVPALELQQINYDCNVVEEILTSVIDEISPNDAPSN